MSKVRYGVQLYGKVRMVKEDVVNKLIGSIQVIQNKISKILDWQKTFGQNPNEGNLQ